MRSDKQLYSIFIVNPDALYHLLGRPVPGPVCARSEVYKELETSTDLAVEPVDEAEPAMLTDFQGYLSEQFIPKMMLRCALYRIRHPARPIQCHVIYLSRSFEWPAVEDFGLFRPQVHYLPDLVRQLEELFPESPLVSVLRPLVVEDRQELTERAGSDYQRISESPELTEQQRVVWLQVFYTWFMIRFQNSLEEISKMVIAGLPAVEETPWGKELKDRWKAEGLTEGRKEGRMEELKHRVADLEQQLQSFAELRSVGELSDAGFHRLTESAEHELAETHAELARLQTEAKHTNAS
jgi:predicted transposase YdaD